jgi:glycosyltransferase involved in cell wall biosynthesis
VKEHIAHSRLKSDTAPPPVALLAQGGREWIGGRIYICNLVRALKLLPAQEQIGFYLILPHSTRPTELSELGDDRFVRYFAFRARDSRAERLYEAKQSLRHMKWPRSLEGVVLGAKVKAVFPTQRSLGREFPVPWIGWIPDFQHKRLPQFFSENELRGRDECFQGVVGEAAHIVVSSQDAHKDLMRWFPTEPHRVSVFPFVSVSADEWYAHDPTYVAAELQLPEKYLIFPSQFWIHKNHRVLCEAIRILRDKGLSDICVVSTGHTNDYRHPGFFVTLQDLIEQRGLKPHIRILGLLPRNVQIHLMRRAAAVIQPSLFEGWSALVEDARTLGKRIYVSDIPIHREQQPSDAVFFDPDRAEQLAEWISRDWADLKPGPDLAEEREARAQQETRAVAFARLFLRIVDRATGISRQVGVDQAP